MDPATSDSEGHRPSGAADSPVGDKCLIMCGLTSSSTGYLAEDRDHYVFVVKLLIANDLYMYMIDAGDVRLLALELVCLESTCSVE